MAAATETPRRWWRAFTAWRRDRPFWGGVLTIAAAVELLALTASPLQVMLIRGLAGIGTLVLAAMLVALAVIAWTHVHLRVICGVFVVILGLASFAVSNLGGFFAGLLLALVGGSLIFAWHPGDPPASPPDTAETGAPRPRGPERAAGARSGGSTAAGKPAAESGSERVADSTSDDTGGTADEADTSPRPSGSGHGAADAVARPFVRPGFAPVLAPGGLARGAVVRSALRFAAVAAVVAAGFIAVPQASAQPAAEPGIPCPTWWPWCETEEPTSPGEDDGDDGEDDGDNGEAEEEPTEPEAECDSAALPAKPPRLGTEAAKRAAKTLAACLALPGTGSAADRDLPTASTFHPVLETDVMTMTGMNSGGVVDVPTADGDQRALEFTMDELELAEMDQSAGIDGTDARLHVINKGSSAVLSGGVLLHVQRMRGLIFGVVPIVLTPDTPLPPIPIPYLVITEATVDTVYTRADRVDLPDLHEPTR